MRQRVSRVVFALAAGGHSAAPVHAPPARAAEPFEINVIVSLTGPFAFIGSNKDGGIKGQPVKMILQDVNRCRPSRCSSLTASSPKQPTSCSGRRTLRHVRGRARDQRAQRAAHVLFRADVAHAAGAYLFSGGSSSNDQATAQMRFIEGNGWKCAALISTTDATGQDTERFA